MKHLLNKLDKTLDVQIDEDILSTSQEHLRQQLMQLLQSPDVASADWNVLKLDLTRVAMIDSAGLNLLVSIIKRVKNQGGRVEAAISSPGVHRTMLFTRLDKQMDVTVVENNSVSN